MAINGNNVQTPGPFNEQLMSFPQIPRKRTAGDGTEPGGSGKSAGGGAGLPGPEGAEGGAAEGTVPEQAVPQAPATPTLETATATLAFQTVDQIVRSQDRLARNRWAIDTHFRRVDAGVPFSRLEKIPNQAIWVAKLPPGMSHECPAAIPNKANDLNNKVTDALLADPPKPNPRSHTNGEGADESGDLAGQFLRLDGGERGTNDVQQFRWAFRSALVSASSFLHYWLDEHGGGYQPYQVLAHPEAQDPAHPLVAMIPDATTGQPMEQRTANPILRYVSAPTPEAPAGQFVKTAADADRVWLPRIRIDRLRREQVRTIPATAPVETASAVVLLPWCTLAEARSMWPTVAAMTPEQLSTLASWRPAMSETLVPYTFRGGMADGMTGPAVTDVGSFSPLLQRRMFYYRMYIAASPEYPNGLTLDISGANGGTILARESMDYTVPTPDGGQDRKCRDIPLVQITPIQDTTDNDPMGWSFISRFAGSAEAAATLYASYWDALDQRLHPHVFIYSTTPVDELDWADRTTPVILNPGDPPVTYEQFPPLPDIVGVVQDIHNQDDVASGLTATAQGLDSENAVSGVAKQLTVRQAQVSMAGMQQQLHAGFTRGWCLKVQIAQAKFSTPQLLSYDGEDGSSEVQWFRGEDLAGVDDVGIEPGTGTMMTAESKANYVAYLQAQGWLQVDRAAEVGLSGIARDLGLPPDPIEQAIERAVTAWLDGPDPQWLAQVQSVKQQAQAMVGGWQQQAAAAEAQGIAPPAPPQPPPLPPPPMNPFAPKPNDSEPEVATKWVRHLSRLMMDPQYDAQAPDWRALLDQKYLAARQALVPPPVDANGQPVQGGQPQGGGAPAPGTDGVPQEAGAV